MIAVVYDVDKQNNVSGNAKRKKKKVQKHSEGSDQEQKDGEEQFESNNNNFECGIKYMFYFSLASAIFLDMQHLFHYMRRKQ